MASDLKSVEIGFFGGMTSARLTGDQLGKLRKAVENGDWVDLETTDGPLALNAGNVIFVRVDEHASDIGFRTG